MEDSLFKMLSKELYERFPRGQYAYISAPHRNEFQGELTCRVWGEWREPGQKPVDRTMAIWLDQDGGHMLVQIYDKDTAWDALPSRYELADVKAWDRGWRKIAKFMQGFRR
jgi:hypothetical protein